jgi:hypothetical protein
MTTAELRGMAEAMKELHAWERTLAPGMKVSARWTWSHGCYETKAEVVRVNEKSVRVRLTAGNTYLPSGRELTLPLGSGYTDRWSWNNGVFPYHWNLPKA